MMTAMTQTPAAAAEDERWSTVLERRAAPFLYAVTSTGVYCRTTCPSRRPRRDRVRFFDSAAAAERAGFRACLRCRPATPAIDETLDRVRNACRRLHDDPSLSVAALSRAARLTPRQLQRDFATVLAVSPAGYATAVRAARFRRAVREGDEVVDATYAAGFGSGSRLYERARVLIGMTPGVFARAARALAIRYTLTRAPGGWLLLAATDEGFCALRLGASRAVLLADLREEFAAADSIREAAADLAPWAALVVAYLEGRARSVELPLEVAGTAFQLRVWDALRRIPPGETRTYGEIAASLGLPQGARAVGNACGANPVALAIPCHRAVGRGAVGGYRWGVARKRALLDLEAGGRARGARGAA